MDHQPYERSAMNAPGGDHAGTEATTSKRQYQRPVLNRVGLLRDLTQFSF